MKPCPFCGSEASLRRSGGDSDKDGYCQSYWVQCYSCGAETAQTNYYPFEHHRGPGSNYKTPEEAETAAIAIWDRRV